MAYSDFLSNALRGVSIGPKRGWDARTNVYASEATRAADLYVFWLFQEQRQEKADLLNLEQWSFLVCSAALLDEHSPIQKSLGLAALERLGIRWGPFAALGAEIKAASPRTGS